MPKILALCLLGLLTCETLHAQRPLRLPWAKHPPRTTWAGKSDLAHMNVSYQLEKRLTQTFEQALQVQKQLPAGYNFLVGDPIQEVFKIGQLNQWELYPEQTFLKNSEQTGNYLASRSNRLVLQEVQRVSQTWAQLNQNVTRLRQEAANTPQPQDPVAWLAQIIPSQIDQLFIGESHGYEKIREFVTHFLPQLRARFTEREILLFTEFLPENFKWTEPAAHDTQFPELIRQYFPIWNAALKAHIQPIGLELPGVINDPGEMRYIDRKGHFKVNKIWASLEGMRLRNERWKKTLAAYREQHPHALFIIYTGVDHSLYNAPFPLATCDPKTFVTTLYPDKATDLESFSLLSSRMVATHSKPAAGEELVDQCEIVQWKSPDFPPLTGFDVRIKWPVK